MILSCRIGFFMTVNQTFGISYLPFRVVMVAFAMMIVAFFANGGSTQPRLNEAAGAADAAALVGSGGS